MVAGHGSDQAISQTWYLQHTMYEYVMLANPGMFGNSLSEYDNNRTGFTWTNFNRQYTSRLLMVIWTVSEPSMLQAEHCLITSMWFPIHTGGTLAAPGFNSQTFFNAGAGTITVAVTDFHGCFAQATINITQPALLTPGTIAANQVLCAGSNPAQLTETVPATGGPGAYNYQWQYGSTAVGPFINIAGATEVSIHLLQVQITHLYYRRMITSGICIPVYSNVIEVLVNPRPVAILTGGETICPSQTSILKVNMMVGTGPFEVDIANLGTVTGYVSGADIVVSPAVTTTYSLTRVRDANGCEVLSPSANLMGSAVVTVRALPAITVIAGKQNVM